MKSTSKKVSVPVRGAARPPLERMMRIHQFLQAGKYPNATKLSRELEVAIKTIHRDIDFMRDRMELPIEYDGRRWGFHYTESVESFPTLQISEGEFLALIIAEKALQQYRGTPFESRIVGALKKLENALPDSISLHLAEWDRTISFHTSAEPIVGIGILDTLARAAANRERLILTYKKPGQKQAEERLVDPYHIANVNSDWYLFAFDHMRKDIRTFVPSRITAARLTGDTFARPEKFSLEKRLRDSFGIHSSDGEFEVVIQFDERVADYIREKRWHPSQRLKELRDGGVELRLKLGSLIEIERWILGWGGRGRVLAPSDLVVSIREAAQRLIETHSPFRGGSTETVGSSTQ